MKKSEFLIAIIKHKYSEWLEMEGKGEQSPDLLSKILVNLLVKEMEENDYYKRRLKEFEKVKR